MPRLPLFSRKSSRRTTGDSDASSASLQPPSQLDRSGSTRSKSLSSSLSGLSIGSSSSTSIQQQHVKPSELVDSFTQSSEQPASRRVPSLKSSSLSSSLIADSPAASSLVPGAVTASPAAETPQHGSQSSATGPAGSLNTSYGNGTAAGVPPTILRSDSSSGDEAYESPDEFVDAEEILSPRRTPSPLTQTHQQSSNDAPLVLRFTPADAARLATPNPRDTPLQADLRQIWYAISLFLNSQFVEAVDICNRHEDRMYYSLGAATLTAISALMSFEPKELGHAVERCKKCLVLADKERNDWNHTGGRGWSWSEKLAGGVGSFTRGSSLTVEIVQRMSTEQRHAELAYGECLLLKAIVSLMYSGDFVAFLKEALNMRSSHAIYKVLRKFILTADAIHPDKYDPSIDLDFRSGVEFGNGCTGMILSLLPSTAVKVVELFGFSSNRDEALEMLMRSGGWSKDSVEPILGEGPGKEGLRRPVCDLVLLVYHLIISSVVPVPDVDIGLAERIISYNLTRYPDGVFFLYFSGRLYSTQTKATRAFEQYEKALRVQNGTSAGFKQIQYIVRWDLSLTHLSTGNYALANENLTVLAKESNWSKAVYSFGQAVTQYESLQDRVAKGAISDADRSIEEHQIKEIMKTIPGYVQRIAGKSLPFEKYVARKSKKYLAQDAHLVLPGLELAYMISCLSLAPRAAITQKHLPETSQALDKLKAMHTGDDSKLPTGWWDDYCLARFMHGILLHYLYRPDPHVQAANFEPEMTLEEADKRIIEDLKCGIDNSLKLELDHHIAYMCHFEVARLLIKLGPSHHAEAKQHLEAVLYGKIEFGPSKGKGKVSMQNGIVLKANAALEQLNDQTKLP